MSHFGVDGNIVIVYERFGTTYTHYWVPTVFIFSPTFFFNGRGGCVHGGLFCRWRYLNTLRPNSLIGLKAGESLTTPLVRLSIHHFISIDSLLKQATFQSLFDCLSLYPNICYLSFASTNGSSEDRTTASRSLILLCDCS